jgi:hypothetical protein
MTVRRSIVLLTLALVATTVGTTRAGAQRLGGSDAVIAAPTKLDGIYQVEQTAAELAALDPTDVDACSYGEATLVFDRGWVRLLQKSDKTSSWASGTFAVRGDKLVMRWEAAGSKPVPCGHSPGDIAELGWSLYRDQLTLSEVPGAAPSLTAYTVKPWRRTAKPPSITFKTPASALLGTWSNGRRVLVLRGGRFSLGTKAAKPQRSDAYEVLGYAIRFRTRYDQFWDYTWSIKGGLLELRHPLGGGWNRELTRKPWRRVRR